MKRGPENGNWRGGRRVAPNGYVLIRHQPRHPRAARNGEIGEHILVVERALGHYLPDGAVVHHVNENKTDNSGSNLVICQDNAYHVLIHRRQRAFDACGNANWRMCIFCKAHDDPSQLIVHWAGRGSATYCHRSCRIAKQKRSA